MVSKTTTYRNIAKAGQYTIFRTAIDFYIPILEKAYDFVRKYPQMPEHQFNEILQYVTWAYERIYENMYWWLQGLKRDVHEKEKWWTIARDIQYQGNLRADNIDWYSIIQFQYQALFNITRFFAQILERRPSTGPLWKAMGMGKDDLFRYHEQYWKLMWFHLKIYYDNPIQERRIRICLPIFGICIDTTGKELKPFKLLHNPLPLQSIEDTQKFMQWMFFGYWTENKKYFIEWRYEWRDVGGAKTRFFVPYVIYY